MVRSPIGVALSTGDALSRIELSPHDNLYFASADLKDRFLSFGTSSWYPSSVWFTGCSSWRHRTWVAQRKARSMASDSFPTAIHAVPMGWSWALYLCQTLHERIVGQVGADDALTVVWQKTGSRFTGFAYRIRWQFSRYWYWWTSSFTIVTDRYCSTSGFGFGCAWGGTIYG